MTTLDFDRGKVFSAYESVCRREVIEHDPVIHANLLIWGCHRVDWYDDAIEPPPDRGAGYRRRTACVVAIEEAKRRGSRFRGKYSFRCSNGQGERSPTREQDPSRSDLRARSASTSSSSRFLEHCARPARRREKSACYDVFEAWIEACDAADIPVDRIVFSFTEVEIADQSIV